MLGIALPPNRISGEWEFIEIQFEKSVSFSLDWKYLGPRYGVHAPYYITLANPNRQKGDYAVHQVLEAAKVGKRLNADIVVARAGFYSKQSPEEAMETVVRNCGEILESAGVPLGIEIRGKRTEFGSLGEVMELRDRLGVVPVLNFQGGESLGALDGAENPYIHFGEAADMEGIAAALPKKYTLVAETRDAAETMDSILSPY